MQLTLAATALKISIAFAQISFLLSSVDNC